MAIKIQGTTVISDGRVLENIDSIDETTKTAFNNAGVGVVDSAGVQPYIGTCPAQDTIGIGCGAFASLTPGPGGNVISGSNVALGYDAACGLTCGYSNVFIGEGVADALTACTSRTVIIGANTLKSDANTAGNVHNESVIIGANAAFCRGNAGGNYNNIVAIGACAHCSDVGTCSSGLIAIGGAAFCDVQAGACQLESIAIGKCASRISLSGNNNYSVSIGSCAATLCGAGFASVNIGYGAGLCSTGRDRNINIGCGAGTCTASTYMVNMGVNAGFCSSNGYGVNIGWEAGYCFRDTNAVNIGYQAGFRGYSYSAVNIGRLAGYEAYNSGTDYGSFNNVNIGIQAGYCGRECCNTNIGGCAGFANCLGSNNVAIGTAAMYSATGNPSCNVAIGSNALVESSNSYGNVAIGYLAARNTNNFADFGTYVGTQAGYSDEGQYNTYIGYQAGYSTNSTSCTDFNIGIGYRALFCLDGNSNRNIAIGDEAGCLVGCVGSTGENNNIAIGQYAIRAGVYSCCNIAIGREAGCLIGCGGVTSNAHNIAIGNTAMRGAGGTNTCNNIAIGTAAAVLNACLGQRNVLIGQNAGCENFGGSNSGTIAIGACAQGLGNGTAECNIAIGFAALRVNEGSNNTVLGTCAGYNISTGCNNIIIGDTALASGTAVCNEITLGNSSITGFRVTGNAHVVFGLDSANEFTNVDNGKAFAIHNNSDKATLKVSNGDPGSAPYGLIGFYRNHGTPIAKITTDGSSVSYNTTSDYRLKENVINLVDAIDRIKLLQPKRFSWIIDNLDSANVDGFIAHEVSGIVPEAIAGDKDQVDDQGLPEYQGIDQSKLVPLLTAALKEAITKIESLEARVATLESV